MFLSKVCLMPRRILNSPFDAIRREVPNGNRFWRKERIFKFSAWFHGDARDKYRCAKQKVVHSFKRQMRYHSSHEQIAAWFYRKRIDGALAEHNVTFELFDDVMKKLNIRLDLQMLNVLAIFEPKSFKSLAMLAKQVGIENQMDMEGTVSKPTSENVITRGVL